MRHLRTRIPALGSPIGAPQVIAHEPMYCPGCGSALRESLVCVDSPDDAVTCCLRCKAILTFVGPIWFERVSELGMKPHQAQQVSVLRTALAGAGLAQ